MVLRISEYRKVDLYLELDSEGTKDLGEFQTLGWG